MSTADIVVRDPNLVALWYSVTSMSISTGRRPDIAVARNRVPTLIPPVGDLLGLEHSWVVDRFIALVGDKVEDLLDRSVDQDFAAHIRHLSAPHSLHRYPPAGRHPAVTPLL
jgi:hypothetical protein